MSAEARPLLEQVKAFIADEVEPITAEFFALGADRADRWSYAPGQLELLDGVKAKAKANGLWNFFLPDAETGRGLTNLDYAYIAAELGRSPLASESLNCSAPDTGNMEVLERVGTPEQKAQWLQPLLDGEIRSCFGMTEPGLASSDARNIATSAVLDGDEWVISGEKYYISGAGDPRCKIMICMVRTSPDAAPHLQQSQILVPMDTPGVEIVGPMLVFGHDDAPARPHAHPADRRPRAEGEHPPRRGPRVRDQPAPARAGPHPPLHALDRRRRPGAAAHGRTGPVPPGVRQAARRPRQEHRGRGPRPHRDRGHAPDGAAGRQGDGPDGQRRGPRVGQRGQGDGARAGVPDHRRGHPDARRDRRVAVDAPGRHVHEHAHPAAGRRPRRGAPHGGRAGRDRRATSPPAEPAKRDSTHEGWRRRAISRKLGAADADHLVGVLR